MLIIRFWNPFILGTIVTVGTHINLNTIIENWQVFTVWNSVNWNVKGPNFLIVTYSFKNKLWKLLSEKLNQCTLMLSWLCHVFICFTCSNLERKRITRTSWDWPRVVLTLALLAQTNVTVIRGGRGSSDASHVVHPVSWATTVIWCGWALARGHTASLNYNKVAVLDTIIWQCQGLTRDISPMSFPVFILIVAYYIYMYKRLGLPAACCTLP